MGLINSSLNVFRKVFLRIPTQDKGKNQIYLVSEADGTWTARANAHGTSVPVGSFLTNEGSYPVDLYYSRTDLNGSSVMEMLICRDRQMLISSLDWIGKCGFSVVALWDFDCNKPLNPDLKDIFNASYQRRLDLIQPELQMFIDESIADEQSTNILLSKRIENASSLSGASDRREAIPEQMR